MEPEPRNKLDWILPIAAFTAVALAMALAIMIKPAFSAEQSDPVIVRIPTPTCYHGIAQTLKAMEAGGLSQAVAMSSRYENTYHMMANQKTGQWAWVVEVTSSDLLCVIDEGKTFNLTLGRPV